jgi:hypothetical protein
MLNRIRTLAMVVTFLFAARAQGQNAAATQPIRLHPANPHYFLFRGRAVVLITSGEHYGAVLNADFDYRKYLAALEADGLNYTRLFGGSYIEVPAKSFGIQRNDLAPTPGNYIAPWMRSDAPGYAGGGNRFDLSQWNSKFFERYRDFLSEAAKRGIVVEVTLFSAHYDENQWKISAFNPANNTSGADPIDWKKLHTLENGSILGFQERYARKLVKEANGFDNVIFEIQNEPWSDQPVLADVINPYLRPPGRDTYPNSIDLASELSIAWQTGVAEWIRSEETPLPNRHLIAQNYCNFRSPVRKLIPGVDIVNFHYAYPEAVLLNYGLGRAISYDETGFLGRDDNAYRRQAWNFMLSGGGVFDNLDYSFSPGHEDGTDFEANGPGGGSPTLRHQLHILREFLQSLPLVDLHPDSHTMVHAAGGTARMLSSPNWIYAMYFDGSGPTDVTLDLPPGQYTAVWMNVQTGAIDRSDNFRHAGGNKVLQTPDFNNGIAVRLEKTPP